MVTRRGNILTLNPEIYSIELIDYWGNWFVTGRKRESRHGTEYHIQASKENHDLWVEVTQTMFILKKKVHDNKIKVYLNGTGKKYD